jgi:DMSO/TMAO reductase YedYZ heme-binding membrane subunit
METIELSGIIGMAAVGILTLNFVMGMMLSTAYKKSWYWKALPKKFKKANITELHNYTAYIALGLVLVHAIIIPLDPASGFKFIDLFMPLNAPHQPNIVLIGAIALLALLIAIVTSQKLIKKQLGFRLWKNIHLISYCTTVIAVIHGVLMDPLLKDRPTDWIDAEKLYIQLCGLLVIVSSILRYRYHLNSKKSSGVLITQED